MKGLAAAVQSALSDVYLDQFVGAQTWNLGAKDFAVGLPMENSQFDAENFSAADYLLVYSFLSSGVFSVPTDSASLTTYIQNLGYEVPAGLADAVDGN